MAAAQSLAARSTSRSRACACGSSAAAAADGPAETGAAAGEAADGPSSSADLACTGSLGGSRGFEEPADQAWEGGALPWARTSGAAGAGALAAG